MYRIDQERTLGFCVRAAPYGRSAPVILVVD